MFYKATKSVAKIKDPLLKTLALQLVFYSLTRNLNRVLPSITY